MLVTRFDCTRTDKVSDDTGKRHVERGRHEELGKLRQGAWTSARAKMPAADYWPSFDMVNRAGVGGKRRRRSEAG